MIEQILKLLKTDVKSDTELIKIARGKYKLATTIKGALKHLKQVVNARY